MKEDEAGYRPAPQQPYVAGSEVLYVPRHALALTTSVLRSSGRLETCCFWYGSANSVSVIAVPKQNQTWGNYFVPSRSMFEIFERVSALDVRNLAQIHSHPGTMVEHSPYDDEMANSRRALSIVFPSYGRWAQEWPTGVGIHEYQSEYWHFLDDDQAQRRVVLTESSEVTLIDCR